MSERSLSPELKEILKDKWVGVVDDSQDYAELVTIRIKDVLGLSGIVTVHEFTGPASFIERCGDFDICFLDGRFSPREMTGPQAVPLVKAKNPGTYIVGYSGEEDKLNEFVVAEADYVVAREELLDFLPKILEAFAARISGV